MKLLDELHHRLGSKSRIRSLFKDVSVQELEKILDRLKGVHKEKLQSRVKEDAKRQKKMKDIVAIHKEMAELGITLSDLDNINDPGKTGKRRRTVTKHTFQYENPAGQTVYWEGSTTGRLPKDFQEYLEKTQKKRAECIIK
ncbi:MULTISPECIES: H-NS family nucleoid-associated regulatory protein [Gammaproteobacteria]|uniref:H-NS family histone-like protein n=1 Tax=Gammaproteobacteria TaxID=1236 RepID=UPI001ADD557F|nr:MULTISPECIES: H-NS family nucleoid-associated regulatory protein [Gammaproteobacteria]MBO9480426.1 H-NS histone family protein [Salinisphaera sp. G21_0]MBO9493647.1 H-NS histone family protein [Thalassotalea sp. G20_0]